MTTMTGPDPRRARDLTMFTVAGAARAGSRLGRSVGRLLPDAPPRWVTGLLAVPLSTKLVGANAMIVIAALGTALYTHRGESEDGRMLVLMTTALALSLIVSVGLVLAALRPLRYLEEVAERVSSGDLAARVPTSALADRNISRVGQTFNRVLDDLIADRARARRLASEVIRVGDQQRAVIGRELNESTAQVLAALTFETSALASGSQDPDLRERLEAIRSLTSDELTHVGLLAQAVHPRVLDDLGLVIALNGLARRVREASDVEVDVHAAIGDAHIPASAAAMLYRVADEAVGNAIRHGRPERVSIRLSATDGAVQLMVEDDGCGFDVAAAGSGDGIGLFMMQERASLAGGCFSLASGADRGTTVQVFLPLQPGARG